MKDIAPLLALRARRLTRLQGQEEAARRERHDAQAAEAELREEIQAFTRHVQQLEMDLIEQLLETEATRFDFDKLHAVLAQAEERAKKLRERLDAAVDAVSRADAALAGAAQARTQAQARQNRLGEMQAELGRARTLDARLKAERDEETVIDTLNAFNHGHR